MKNKEEKTQFISNFNNKNEFIDYLKNTLIPDLKEAGNNATAKDFEEAIHWLKL